VAGGEVVIAAADLLLELADFLGKEFDRTAALGADHVMVTAAIVLVLVAGDAVVKSDFAGKPALGEEFQGAVDGGVADAGIFFLHQAVKFVRRKVIASFEEGAENGIALGGLFEANFLEMAMEDVLGFADHLAGDGGLIIDALLQHGQAAVRIAPRRLENEIHFQPGGVLVD